MLRKYLNQEYKKADENQLKKFLPLTKTAVANAKNRHQNVLKNYKKNSNSDIEPIWKWNPSTSVYRLVEELKLYYDKLKK